MGRRCLLHVRARRSGTLASCSVVTARGADMLAAVSIGILQGMHVSAPMT